MLSSGQRFYSVPEGMYVQTLFSSVNLSSNICFSRNSQSSILCSWVRSLVSRKYPELIFFLLYLDIESSLVMLVCNALMKIRATN